MNAITNGKIEGWPKHLKTVYVDSGSNVDPAFERLIVLDHILDSTGRTKEACIAKLHELDFTDEMIHGTIGSLSGGWQMKMRLVRAVLADPDIFLLDEPTNHLSHAAARWITDFLLKLTHQTVPRHGLFRRNMHGCDSLRTTGCLGPLPQTRSLQGQNVRIRQAPTSSQTLL